MLIYKVTNKINGKRYIGRTVNDLKQRKYRHIWDSSRSKDNNQFHNAIRKYRPENFEWEVIYRCDTIQELNRLEIYYICYYNTFENGYNLTLGGCGSVGYKPSEETLEKMRNRTISEETRRKMSEARIGIKLSEETKNKMSINASGAKNNMYNVRLFGELNHFYGKKHKKKAILKMSEARIGKQVGKNNPSAKAVIIDDRYFDTVGEAAKFVGVVLSAIRYRILHKTKWSGYKYVCKEEN